MKAVLVGVDWEGNEVITQFFAGDDPIKKAWDFLPTIKDDFEGYGWVVTGDNEAKRKRSNAILDDWAARGIYDDPYDYSNEEA